MVGPAMFLFALLACLPVSLEHHLEWPARDRQVVLNRLRGGSTTEGKLYVFGGFSMKSLYTDTVESINLSQKDRWYWKRKPYMKVAKASLCAVALKGKIYLVGGQDSRYFAVQRRLSQMTDKNETVGPHDVNWPTLDIMEVFDPKQDSNSCWTFAPPMFERRVSFSAAALAGRLWVCGGYNGERVVSSLESFDPQDSHWTTEADLPRPRFGIALAASTAEGLSLYAIGGSNGEYVSKAVDIFDVKTRKWRMGPDMLTARSSCAAVEIKGKIYVMGGLGEEGCLNSMEVLDLKTEKWERCLGDGMQSKRSAFGAVAYEGRIFVVGGCDGEKMLDTAEVYDDKEGWADMPKLKVPRGALGVALL